MRHQVIVDTGVLIALVDRHDRHNVWGTEQLTKSPHLYGCFLIGVGYFAKISMGLGDRNLARF